MTPCLDCHYKLSHRDWQAGKEGSNLSKKLGERGWNVWQFVVLSLVFIGAGGMAAGDQSLDRHLCWSTLGKFPTNVQVGAAQCGS